MRFRQLTLRDDVLIGEFALTRLLVSEEETVTVWAGIVAGDRRDTPTVKDPHSPSSRTVVNTAARIADGKRVVVPMGSVLWAEAVPEEDEADPNHVASLMLVRPVDDVMELTTWPRPLADHEAEFDAGQ